MNAFLLPESRRPPSERQTIGRQGEDQALAFLLQHDLTLVERNFRCRRGEIDLIMREGDTLVFVEVRKRRHADFGGAAASVTPAKQARMVMAAQIFLQGQRPQPPCRFDVIAIDAGGFDWLKNVIEV